MDAPEARPVGPTRRWALTALLVALAACGPEEAEDLRDTEAPATAEAVDEAAPTVAASAVPTRRWTERREVAEVDAAFPHSDHRDVDCQRCHTRPAGHVTHTDVECTRCHGRPAGYAELPVKSARECAACHHDAGRATACSSCHESGSRRATPVLAAVPVGDGGQVRVRTMTFDHGLHGGQACTRCHTEPVTRAFTGDCSSCHDEHHTPESNCTACHQATGLEAHAGARVHTGCAGAGCHADTRVLSLAPSRNVCLACHADLVDHHVDRECTQCHVGTLRSLSAARRGR